MAGKKMASSIEEQIKKRGDKIKTKLEIKDDMSIGQKMGKVMGKITEKSVDILAVGIKKGMKTIEKKMDETQSAKFASPAQLKMDNFEELIGENKNGGITAEKAETCKYFVKMLKRKLSPRKETTKEIVKDAIKSASVNPDELLNYLKNEKTVNTKAEVEYINKEIRVLVEKFVVKKGGKR